MPGSIYFVGLEPAVEELLHRTDALDDRLTTIHSLLEKLAMTFEEKAQLLIDYAKALKAQLAALENGEAEATIAALREEVAATKAALDEAQGLIAADTEQEEILGAQIDELLAPPAVVEPDPMPEPEPPADEQPLPEEPPFVEEDPIVTPDPIVEPAPEPITADDMVA